MFDNSNLQQNSEKRFYPNLMQSWILVLCFLPLLIFVAVLGVIMKAINFDSNFISFIEYSVALGMLVLIAFIFKNRVADKPFIHYKNKVSAWVYVLVIPAVISLGGLADMAGTMLLPEMPDALKQSLEETMSSNFFTILTAVIAAPALEEIICRGIICEGLIKNISPRAAILWSAFIFAVIHLNPWQGLSAFAIGCFLGWIYWKTRSIIPCIFIHFVNNALAMFAYHYYVENLNYDLTASSSEIYGLNEIAVVIINCLIFLASLALLVKVLKPKQIIEDF
ncbi:MAG: CPBP family intramembrane metalloprotease [Prevotellaceae bacterium]|jgi:membrane protease YdiL (CAAX protease family)|nr:CPBP family intramembrane metalloprotease [Prevotellaceae bacterium]